MHDLNQRDEVWEAQMNVSLNVYEWTLSDRFNNWWTNGRLHESLVRAEEWERKHEIATLQKQVYQNNNFDLLTRLIKMLTGKDILKSSNLTLSFYMHVDEDRELNLALIQAAKYQVMPPFRRMEMDCMYHLAPEDTRLINQFFKNSIVHDMKEFYIHHGKFDNYTNYRDGLEVMLPKVRKEILIREWNLSQEDLESLINASFQTFRLVLHN